MPNKKPPKVKITVPAGQKSTAKGSPFQQFIAYWRNKPDGKFLRNQALVAAIQSAANEEHVNAVAFAALLLNESRANPDSPDSDVGAVGIGQLMPSSFVGGFLPWAHNHKITENDLRDLGTNLRLSAWYMGQMQGSYPDNWYGAYNMGPNAAKNDPATASSIQASFQQKWINPWNKNYTFPAPTSPPSKAGTQAPGGTAQQAQDNSFKNPYVAGVDKRGKFHTTNDPNKAMKFDGEPLSITGFKSLQDSLSSYYISYTGKRPSAHQVQNYIQNGWSTYTLTQLLSKSPSFKNSPVYKQNAPQLNAALKDMLPQGTTVPAEILRQAIIHNWDATTVAAKVRQLPGYVNSNEFKGNVASLLNVHQSIMGTPDQASMVAIKDAALQGWTADQYAAWLRSQPGYTSSTEYQQNMLGMLGALGLITGQQVTLQPGKAPASPFAGTSGTLPSDKRVPGTPSAGGGNGLIPTLSG